MTRLLALLPAAAIAAAAPAASATVLSFDDLGADTALADVAHYGGLDWSAGDWFAFGEPQDPYTAHSGSFRAATGFGDPDSATAIVFTTPAVFQGAWFSGLEGATVTFDLFYRGTQVATSASLDPSATPQFLASGYAGPVDRVIVSSPGQGSFAMDDFTFTDAVPAVPEPRTYALLLAGLAAVSTLARRDKR